MWHIHTMEYNSAMKKKTDPQTSRTSLWLPGGRMGEGIVRESGMDMDTRLDLTWRTSKDLLASSGKSPQYSVIT